MKWRPKWGTVTVALGLIAALAMISPALGGPSLQSLVEKRRSQSSSPLHRPRRRKSRSGDPRGLQVPPGRMALRAVPSVSSPSKVTAPSTPRILRLASRGPSVSLDNGDREFCFNGLPFDPKIAIGEIDSNFGVGYTVRTDHRGRGGRL